MRHQPARPLLLAALSTSLLAACPGEPPPTSTCTPSPEICDGVDNNCDGRVDEGCNVECIVGATDCFEGRVRTCVDAGATVTWGAFQDCPSGVCADSERCAQCADECPAAGETRCADGQLRTCAAGANGCLNWGPATACADGFCASESACGACEHGCPALGAAECTDGALRSCVADADGCRDWGPETACASGFCGSAESCGNCNDTCPGSGRTECTGGQLRTCEADAAGCLAWSAYAACADGFCADATTCGACTDACSAGDAQCTGGRVRTCEADANGCMGWSSYTACAEGFCADAATCGTCTDACAAGDTQCTGGRVRTCQADANGCMIWSGYTDCAQGFCADATSCGACTDACSAGASQCTGGQVRTCEAGADGCLDWSSYSACAEGFCADATSCGTCNDVCVEGESQCTGGAIRTCQADANGCLGWDAGTACPARHICENDVCVASTSHNDTCASAQPLTFNGDTAVALGDTNQASDSAEGTCVMGDTKDLVYSFTLSSPRSVTATATSYAYAGGLSVYLRKSCGSDAPLDELSCDKQYAWSWSNGEKSTSTSADYLPAGTYYVWVDGFGGEEAGSIRLEVTLGAPVPPPANDTCSGAEPLQFTGDTARVIGTTAGALNDSYSQCGGDTSADVVYSFTLTTPRAADIELRSRSYDYTPVLRLASSCDTPGEEVLCRVARSSGNNSYATFNYTYLEPGTYYVWAEGRDGSEGEFQLEVVLGTPITPPANDTCAGAEPLSFFNGSATASATTTGALPSGQGTCGGYLGNDVVYSFTTATSASVDVDLAITASPVSTYGTVYLRSDCADAATQLECAKGQFNPSQFFLSSVPAGTYYVWVDNDLLTDIDFDLNVTLGDAFVPPDNDTCQGAHRLNVATYSNEESGATVYATTYQASRDHTTCSADGTHPEVVFSFYAQNSGSHSVKLVSSTDMALWLSDGTCGGACAQYSDSIAGPGTEWLHLQTVAGRTYYVYVGGAQPGEFTILVKRNLP